MQAGVHGRDLIARATATLLDERAFQLRIEDPELAVRVQRRLPEELGSQADALWVVRLLGVLHQVDPAAALPYARRWRSDERFEHGHRMWFDRIVADSEK